MAVCPWEPVLSILLPGPPPCHPGCSIHGSCWVPGWLGGALGTGLYKVPSMVNAPWWKLICDTKHLVPTPQAQWLASARAFPLTVSPFASGPSPTGHAADPGVCAYSQLSLLLLPHEGMSSCPAHRPARGRRSLSTVTQRCLWTRCSAAAGHFQLPP